MVNLLPATTNLFLLVLSVSACASASASATLSTADTDSDLVVDFDGNPLEVGSQYYIQSIFSLPGGVGRSARSPTPADYPCPLYAFEYPHEDDNGDPIKFVPADATRKQIHLSSDVQIDSGVSTYCGDDGLWRMSDDGINGRIVIIASGASNVPPTSFKIETTGGSKVYNITYCPPPRSSLRLQGSSCLYLTRFQDILSGMIMLGLTDDAAEAFPVIFAKYKRDVVATI